jgi:hypothetical protein
MRRSSRPRGLRVRSDCVESGVFSVGRAARTVDAPLSLLRCSPASASMHMLLTMFSPGTGGPETRLRSATLRLLPRCGQPSHPCLGVRSVRRDFVSRRRTHPISPSRISVADAHRSVATSMSQSVLEWRLASTTFPGDLFLLARQRRARPRASLLDSRLYQAVLRARLLLIPTAITPSYSIWSFPLFRLPKLLVGHHRHRRSPSPGLLGLPCPRPASAAQRRDSGPPSGLSAGAFESVATSCSKAQCGRIGLISLTSTSSYISVVSLTYRHSESRFATSSASRPSRNELSRHEPSVIDSIRCGSEHVVYSFAASGVLHVNVVFFTPSYRI